MGSGEKLKHCLFWKISKQKTAKPHSLWRNGEFYVWEKKNGQGEVGTSCRIREEGNHQTLGSRVKKIQKPT